MPSPWLTVILTLDDHPLRVGWPRETPAEFETVVAGLHARPAQIHHHGHQHGIQLALTGRGARALLGLPARAVAGITDSLEVLLGHRAGQMLDAVRSQPGWASETGTRSADPAWPSRSHVADLFKAPASGWRHTAGMDTRSDHNIWPGLTSADPLALRA